jgi:hypothetical protein
LGKHAILGKERSMRRAFYSIFFLAALMAPAAGQSTQDKDIARAILERAILAHGGKEKLKEIQVEETRFRGTTMANEVKTPFEGEQIQLLPNYNRKVIRFSSKGAVQTVIQVLHDDIATIRVNNQAAAIDPQTEQGMRLVLKLARAMRLVPLLTDPAYSLAATGPTKVGERDADGIKVSAKGQGDIWLYFDRQTSLLTSAIYYFDEPNGVKARHDAYYGDYREDAGLQRPHKISWFREGKLVMEAEILNVKFLEKVPTFDFQ